MAFGVNQSNVSPQRVAQEVHLVQAHVVQKARDMLAQRLGPRGGQGHIVQGQHGNDDPHLSREMRKEVLKIAQRTKQTMQQHKRCSLLCTLHISVVTIGDQLLCHST